MSEFCREITESKICNCGKNIDYGQYDNAFFIVKVAGGLNRAFKISREDLERYLHYFTIPEGVVIDWVGKRKLPEGWLDCNGYRINKVTYPELAKILESSQLFLPQTRGRIVVQNSIADTTSPSYIATFDEPILSLIDSDKNDRQRQLTEQNIPAHNHRYYDTFRDRKSSKTKRHNGGYHIEGFRSANKKTSFAGNGQPWYHTQKC